MTEQATRREPIIKRHCGWTLTITDDCPIEDGQTYASQHSVLLAFQGATVREVTCPSYKIWTLLAHWTDDLPEPPLVRPFAPDVLTQLRDQGNSRRDRWHTPDTEPWTGADWSNAMCGEASEAANVVKKIRRLETGTGLPTPVGGLTQEQAVDLSRAELIQMLAHELADTIAYADLLAQHYGIDLRRAIAEKFNIVSEREGFPERIEVVR